MKKNPSPPSLRKWLTYAVLAFGVPFGLIEIWLIGGWGGAIWKMFILLSGLIAGLIWGLIMWRWVIYPRAQQRYAEEWRRAEEAAGDN
jgi:hypothetical protein